jgi:malonyl-CoA O-methyltransferase
MSNHEAKSVGKRFSAAAYSYEVLATVQDRAAEELLNFLPAEIAPPLMLEVGCGTGLLTRRLLRRFPNVLIDAVDIAERMIERAKEACGQSQRVSWFVSDTLQFQPARRYPLIVSNSSLHWLDHLPLGFEHLAKLLEPGGHLVFSIMLHGTLIELRESRKKAAPHKPPLRELPNADEVLQFVQQARLSILSSDIQEYKISYRSAAAFLRAIHDQGITGGTLSRSSKPLTRREIEDLIMEYEWSFHDDVGMVPATYKALFVHAQKTDAS